MLVIHVLLSITAAVQVMGEPAILYRYTTDYHIIWKDAGSGGNNYGSFWRPVITGDYRRLGDVAKGGGKHGNWDAPVIKALLVRSMDKQALKHPTGFTKIWRDLHSGAVWKVRIYRMNAPAGYTCLGNAVMRSWDDEPKAADYYCVLNAYTVSGHLSWTYDDKGTGTWSDLSVWTVEKVLNTNGIAGGNFLSIDNYKKDGLTGLLLNGDGIKVVNEKIGIKEFYISNVKYNLTAEHKIARPVSAATVVLENKSDLQQQSSATLSYSETKSTSYTFTKAFTAGISVGFDAGIPLIGQAKTSVTASSAFTWVTGTTNTTTTTQSIQTWVQIPPQKQCTAEVVATEYEADIPYTAEIHKLYYNGISEVEKTTGVYRGVATTNFKVRYGKFENITESVEVDSPRREIVPVLYRVNRVDRRYFISMRPSIVNGGVGNTVTASFTFTSETGTTDETSESPPSPTNLN